MNQITFKKSQRTVKETNFWLVNHKKKQNFKIALHKDQRIFKEIILFS